MSVLHLLSYASGVAAFVFVVLSLASGLLWLSELIEEHSRFAKSVGQRSIYVIIALHGLLYFFDSLPLLQILFSVFCHLVYLQNFSASWPFISLTSISFISSCVLVIIDHFMWFFHFAHVTQDARRTHRPYGGRRSTAPLENIPGFADIATFFGICVWLAPLFLFLSLSANDNTLPTITGEPATPTSPSKPIPAPERSSLFKSLFRILPLDSVIRLRSRRRETEGLIAPHSPMRRASSPSPMIPPLSPNFGGRTSPLPSPRLSGEGGGGGAFEDYAGTRLRSSNFKLGPPPRSASGPILRPSRLGERERPSSRRVASGDNGTGS